MKVKLGVHYIVTKKSNDNEIKEGETLVIRYDKNETLGDYTIYTPVREGDSGFFGKPAIHHTRIMTHAKLVESLKGVHLVLNKDLGEKLILELQEKIEKLKQDYEL